MSINLRNELTDIADAIRTKLNTQNAIKPEDFASSIGMINTSDAAWNAFKTTHSSSYAGGFAFWGAGVLDALHSKTERSDFGTASDKRISITGRADFCFYKFNQQNTPRPNDNAAFNQNDVEEDYGDLYKHIRLDSASPPSLRQIFFTANILKVPAIKISATSGQYSANAFASESGSSATITEIEKIIMSQATVFNTSNINSNSSGSPFYRAARLTTIRFQAFDSNNNGQIKTSINFQDSPLSHDTLYNAVTTDTYGKWSGLIQALYDFTANNTTPANGQGTITLKSTSYSLLSAAEIAEATAKGWTIASV